jgi:hypothetical protein
LDESVGIWVGDVLGLRHSNVETAEQAKLLGRADSDHFAYCWRRGRVLVTHDFDFYDYKNPELPDIRNPGVIVLDCDSGNAEGVEAILALFPRPHGVDHYQRVASARRRLMIHQPPSVANGH